jgi:YD repeat-containing protein
VTTSFCYDPLFSQLTCVIDPLQHRRSFGYDNRGNLITATDSLGNTSTFTRDNTGRLLSVADPLGNAQRFA